MSPADRSDLPELAALADGSLDPSRRAAVQRRIDASPELSAIYERERRIVQSLREARAERAPATLRSRIEAQRPRASVRRRRRAGYAAGLAGALAALLLALVLVLPGGTPGAPSVSQAAGLAAQGPVRSAPAPDPRAPRARLSVNVQDTYFPNWSSSFGWQAVGERIDRPGGKLAVTVYYAKRGQLVAYTILAAPALRQPTAPVTRLNGVKLRTLSLHGRAVVTWRRGGETCVLSGAGVRPEVLQWLAADYQGTGHGASRGGTQTANHVGSLSSGAGGLSWAA